MDNESLPILFRDTRFVVLDKPAGLAVHPGPRGGPSVEDWFPRLGRFRRGPWLVHRLDADTSGCLVIALRRAALLEAQSLFASGGARKTYWALVHGVPEQQEGRIDAPLIRRSTKQGWWMATDPAGQAAVTEWRVRGTDGRITWLELTPRTGRTHQIRVHCALLGHPLLGDAVYGDGQGKLHLLARALVLPLGPPLSATAPPPGHMLAALGRCGFSRAETRV